MFQRFTRLLWAGTLSLGGVMREGLFCDHWNFPRIRLSGSGLSWTTLAKVRSALVPMFHGERRNWTLHLGHTAVQGCWLLSGIQALTVRRCFAVALVNMLAVEVVDIQIELWERRDGGRWESWAWRFLDVNDLISGDVYAQPLSLCLLWKLIDPWPFQQLVNNRGKAVVPA